MNCKPDVVISSEDDVKIAITVSVTHGTLYDGSEIILEGDWVSIRKTILGKTWILEIMDPRECIILLKLIQDRAVKLGWRPPLRTRRG